MNINIKSRNMEITPAIREYVEKRLSKFDKLMGGVEDTFQVTMSVQKDRHKIEVMVYFSGVLLRGEEESSNMFASIDEVVEKLERQVRKQKTRLQKKVKSKNHKAALQEMLGEADVASIVRTKRFSIDPMSVDEAIMQMNLLGHNFFLFANIDDNKVNVLYIRNDGNYGVLIPELD